MTIFFFASISRIVVPVTSKDLSIETCPIGTLFADGSPDIVEISSEQKNFYEENGYFAGIRLLGGEQIAALRLGLAEMIKPEYADDPRFYEYNRNESTDPSKRLFHVLGAWRVSPPFHDLIFYKPMIWVATSLLGGPVRFWHDQLFVKPAHDGSVVSWHQDYSYWTRTTPVAHLTCWIGLDDSTKENGCVHYVPGSHRWELLPRMPLADDMNAVLELLDEDQKANFKPIPIELKAGEASFHHPMMVHGSYENRSDKPRRAVVINFVRDGVLSDTDEPLLNGIPAILKGERLDGRFFPLLSSDF